ncbi:MAG: hypothetical protein Q8P19_00765 [bacterium]|nr:hypothetical protein [bacterium]
MVQDKEKGRRMTEASKVELNPATAWSIRQAGNRKKALKSLRLLSEYVDSGRERMRKCLRYGGEFKGRPNEVAYFQYLLAAKGLMDGLYPIRPKKH